MAEPTTPQAENGRNVEHGYGDDSDCLCGRNFATVRGLREHLTKARQRVLVPEGGASVPSARPGYDFRGRPIFPPGLKGAAHG